MMFTYIYIKYSTRTKLNKNSTDHKKKTIKQQRKLSGENS